MSEQQQLKELLHYDPETGIFTWRVSRGSAKVGKQAGYLNAHGYIVIRVFDRILRASRLAYLYMTGEWPKELIDHANMVRNDNRWLNLRPATRGQNKFNEGMQSNNKSGYKGVSWHKVTKKWRVQGQLNKKNHHLGLFDTPELAAAARDAFAKEHHGEFYRRSTI